MLNKTLVLVKFITGALGLFCSFSIGLSVIITLKFSNNIGLSKGEITFYILTALILTGHIIVKRICKRSNRYIKNKTDKPEDIKTNIYSIVGIIIILFAVLGAGIFMIFSGSFEIVPDEEDIEKMVIAGYTIAYCSLVAILSLIDKIRELTSKL